MLFFGHVGITIGAAHLISRLNKNPDAVKKSELIDYRFIALSAILPDIIDKPIGILYRSSFGNNTRLAAHTLIFCLFFLIIMQIIKKNKSIRFRSTAAWVVFGFWGHMVLDRMWLARDRITFFYPFLGPIPAWEESPFIRWALLKNNYYTVYGELIGLIFMIYLFLKYQLHKKNNFIQFFRNGLLRKIN